MRDRAGSFASGTSADALEPTPTEVPEASPHALKLNAEAVALAEQRRFEEAAERLRRALFDSPGVPLLEQNLQAVLLGWAERLEFRGDTIAATELLEEAAELGPRFEVSTMLGALYLASKELGSAQAHLSRAFAEQPQRADVALGLAEALSELDDRAAALDVLYRAKENGAVHPNIDTLVRRLEREVDAEWDFVRVETPHFDLDFDEAVAPELVDQISAALETAYQSVGALLGHYPERPARAVLYGQEDFHLLTQTADWAQGVFDGRIKVPLRGFDADDATLAPVLRHEYAHHVVRELAGDRCPTWLNEGVAMWAEGSNDQRDRWAAERLSDAPLVPLTTLRGSFSRMPAEQAERAYAQSYMAVLHLLDRHGSRSLIGLLEALGRGERLGAAFRNELRQPLSDFDAEVARELRARFGAR